jgi:hypothetical protein
MARQSVAAAVAAEHAVASAPMDAPICLTDEQARDWAALVDAGRLGPDQAPLLLELVLAMARSRRVAAELETMRTRPLTASTKAGKEARGVYLQLAAASAAEAKLIAGLCQKMRLARQTKTRAITAERERERVPHGPRPWDVERHN